MEDFCGFKGDLITSVDEVGHESFLVYKNRKNLNTKRTLQKIRELKAQPTKKSFTLKFKL